MTRLLRMVAPGLVVISIMTGLVGCKSKPENADGSAGTADKSASAPGTTPTPSHGSEGADGDMGALPPPGSTSSEEPPAGSPGAAPPPGSPGAPSAAPATPIVPSGPPKQIVAKVNGQPIMRGEMDFMVKNVSRERGITVPPGRYPEFRHQVLDDLVSKELLYEKATASKFTVTPAEIADRLTKIKGSFSDEKAFKAQMAQDGMDEGGVEMMIRQDTAIDKFIRSAIAPKVTVAPEEEVKFYEANKTNPNLKHSEQIRASHILLRVEKGAPDAVKQAQKAKAADLAARAKKGEDFAALAKTNSQDPGSAARGGDLGWFGKGQMVPAFDTAAWALKKGEISGVVESPFGFHIIKILDRRPEGIATLGDIRGQIREYLTNQKVKAETQKVIDTLRGTAKIEITP